MLAKLKRTAKNTTGYIEGSTETEAWIGRTSFGYALHRLFWQSIS